MRYCGTPECDQCGHEGRSGKQGNARGTAKARGREVLAGHQLPHLLAGPEQPNTVKQIGFSTDHWVPELIRLSISRGNFLGPRVPKDARVDRPVL